MLHRRSLLRLTTSAVIAPALLAPGMARADEDHMAERSIGDASAKVTVQEFFSLTCPHCAAFAREVFPQIKENLIATGKVRWVFRDYPLDRLALNASQVARYLPVDRYDPFIEALLATQMRWAFARGINNLDEMFKTAALAGMSRQTFDAAIADTALQNAILADQDAVSKKEGVDSTPTFIANGQKKSGEMDYASFAKWMTDLGA
jgi:protein-disulfide isomerase